MSDYIQNLINDMKRVKSDYGEESLSVKEAHLPFGEAYIAPLEDSLVECEAICDNCRRHIGCGYKSKKIK